MSMIQAWKKIREEIGYKNFRTMLKVIYELPNGSKGDFDIVRENDAVAILALTPDYKVVIARQYRPGIDLIANDLPGGAVDPGEEPAQAAVRELLEETGYEGNMHFLARSIHDAYSTRWKYSFVATDCRKIQAQHLDEYEEIEVIEMNLEDFRAHIRRGELCDVDTAYMGLEHLGLL